MILPCSTDSEMSPLTKGPLLLCGSLYSVAEKGEAPTPIPRRSVHKSPSPPATETCLTLFTVTLFLPKSSHIKLT